MGAGADSGARSAAKAGAAQSAATTTSAPEYFRIPASKPRIGRQRILSALSLVIRVAAPKRVDATRRTSIEGNPVAGNMPRLAVVSQSGFRLSGVRSL